jgi:hypothetical protein
MKRLTMSKSTEGGESVSGVFGASSTGGGAAAGGSDVGVHEVAAATARVKLEGEKRTGGG